MNRPALLMRRTPSGLVPAHAIDAEALEAYGIGAEVEVVVKQRRSTQHHRWFFEYLSKVVASGSTPFKRTEQLLEALKLETGVTEIMRTMDGKYLVKPASISFAAMDQAEFKRFSEESIRAIAEHYGIHPEAVMETAA